MRLLALETTSQHGSLALFQDEDCLACLPLAGRSYAATLLSSIQTLLDEHHLLPSHLDLIAVANGPGSFTGIRIGLATVKAMMETIAVPAIAIGTLEAIAASAPAPALAVMDAGRGSLYVGGALDAVEESVGAFSHRLAQWNGTAVTPDATLIERWPSLQLAGPELAPVVGRLALARWRQNPAPLADALTLDARYLGARWGS